MHGFPSKHLLVTYAQMEVNFKTILFTVLLSLSTFSRQCVSANRQKRIIRGTEISILDVPYMLSLALNVHHICGAAIINNDWGVTAAHCTTHDSDLSVRSGSSTLKHGGMVHKVTQVIQHELYNQSSTDFDIAVFQVEPRFELTYTKPVKLPTDRESTVDNWGLATGWGYFSPFRSQLSDVLEYVILPKVPWDECQKDYLGRANVSPRAVCYSDRKGEKDTCQGDSGGPLVNVDNVIIGITSWGDGCAKAKSPGVYTNVMLFVDWIKNHTGM
ncbi:trypsin-1 [Orussus abietinus]|uniref:trypsin-1 n=1 Tax=Orussus abietinus TaxID=222816 RepID=UPI0006252CEB|nr:trypsin-1 [Orussus abietinus]